MPELCPRCGAVVGGDQCPRCGVVVALYRTSMEKLRRGPAVAPARSPELVPAPVARPTEPAGSRHLAFHGSAGGLFGIQAVNVLLTLLTLGIYYFWGKARVRAYLLGETELEGDRLAYHGTGRELLTGFVKGVAVLFVPFALLTIVPQVYGAPDVLARGLSMMLYLLGLVLIPLAMVGARRYRLSRSSWRGVRFSFRGPAREFVRIFVIGTILTSLTLGIYYPVFVTRRQAFMISHSYFGSGRFDFDARGRELIRPFLLMAVLFLPTLGLSWFWFSARRHRLFTAHTRFGATRFRSTVTGGRLAWLTISNVVAIVLTLGLAWPWTVVRGVRFTLRYLTLEEPLDLAEIRQDAQAASATGEGLAGLLDADFGVS
ncbi:MAG: DUF898 domain-containing protein [Candidatus Rokuibacteriota bacterium]|nr:MAG: DUF898 domain-containing protein [Candidatus Rokubacteria bacterium]